MGLAARSLVPSDENGREQCSQSFRIRYQGCHFDAVSRIFPTYEKYSIVVGGMQVCQLDPLCDFCGIAILLRTCSKITSHFSLGKHGSKCGFIFKQLLSFQGEEPLVSEEQSRNRLAVFHACPLYGKKVIVNDTLNIHN